MRSPLPPRSAEQLVPLRADILARARADSERLDAEAEQRAAAMVAEADREAAAIASRAIDAGVAAAEADAALRSARERRRAHELRLAGRESLHHDLEAAVLERASELKASADYPALLAALEARATALLGPEATVTEDPEGGIVAVHGARRLDLTLPALARATIESMAGEVSGLWTE
ncbi:hypothetical protein [Demequina salsinemoris]|uniref:hypothetical protein n=1 Tax=Demequina salsinemoris TaxID=577470 RepID=UPI000780C1A4|nr:hypothetical protein [Demequina salsinemoris]